MSTRFKSKTKFKEFSGSCQFFLLRHRNVFIFGYVLLLSLNIKILVINYTLYCLFLMKFPWENAHFAIFDQTFGLKSLCYSHMRNFTFDFILFYTNDIIDDIKSFQKIYTFARELYDTYSYDTKSGKNRLKNDICSVQPKHSETTDLIVTKFTHMFLVVFSCVRLNFCLILIWDELNIPKTFKSWVPGLSKIFVFDFPSVFAMKHVSISDHGWLKKLTQGFLAQLANASWAIGMMRRVCVNFCFEEHFLQNQPSQIWTKCGRNVPWMVLLKSEVF